MTGTGHTAGAVRAGGRAPGTAVVARALAVLVASAVGCATAPPSITKIVNGRVIATRSVSHEAYEHMARALLYEQEGRWEEVVAELNQALVHDSRAPEVRAHLAEALLQLGRTDDAATAVRESLVGGVTVDGLVAEAHVRQAKGDLRGAVGSLERAVKMVAFDEDPGQAENAHLELAEAHVLALQVEEARSSLRRLCQAAPESTTGRVRLAAMAWALGALGEAELRIKEAIEEEPNQVDAQLFLAWLQAAQGRVVDARARFEEALDRSEGGLEVAAAYARFLMGIGDEAGARQVADEYGPSDVADETLGSRMDLERVVKRPEKVMALATEALAGDVDANRKAALTLVVAEVQDDGGKHAEAVKTYLSVAKGSGSFNESRLRAATLLRQDGNTTEAARVLAEIVPDAKDEKLEIELAVALAAVDEKVGDPAAGIARLDQALGRYPDSARLTLARAGVEERRGRWQAALAAVDKLLAKDPGNAEALNFWGFVAADHDSALALATKRLRAALALEPGAGSIIDSLGWLYLRSGDSTRAAVFLEQAGRLEPEDAEILSHLGELYLRRAEPDRAAQALRKALTLKPEDDLRRKVEAALARLPVRKASGP